MAEVITHSCLEVDDKDGKINIRLEAMPALKNTQEKNQSLNPRGYIDTCKHSHLQPPSMLLSIPSFPIPFQRIYSRGCCCI